ncbi:MAG: hypothetical protein QNJ20_02590 [Paracoccaceae bacterium]|nr:hypothetical protein [Paracoccaceae bacterium]
MADDCLVGFKFLEKDDLINDTLVKDASELMFNEVVFDAGFDHLGAKSEDAMVSKNAPGVARSDDLESFDFSEGFDFAF